MPNTIRCAASPDSVAATVGTSSTVRKPCSQPVDDRVGGRPVDGPRGVVGAEHAGAKRTRENQRDSTGTAARKMAAAAPASPAPNSQRGTSMKLAPRNAATAPIGGGDRVHRHHLFAGHHVRQCGRQTRRDEAGQAVDQQRGAQQR